MDKTYSGSGAFAGAQTANTVQPSRIDSDIERVLSFISRVNSARDRVARQTSLLGYYNEQPVDGKASGTVAPISRNLSNALADLDRSIDALNGALCLFD